jgi:HAD superfamily hydrolase (TIGR01509 family)
MNRTVRGCILFDWGDTLMVDFKDFSGPMKDWPRVGAVPGAAETLTGLHAKWALAIATNADVSDEPDIRAALRRVDLDPWIDRIYCFKNVGHKKPSPEFYRFILDDLGLPPERVVMVGDNYQADVLGPLACGLWAVWFNPHTDEERKNERQRTIHELSALPQLLKNWPNLAKVGFG